MKRGRPSTIDIDDLKKIIFNNKENIVIDKTSIISKHDGVWNNISKEMGYAIKPESIYTFVTCNRYNIRSELFPIQNTSMDSEVNSSVASSKDVTLDESLIDNNDSLDTPQKFSFRISCNEFLDLVVEKTYKRTRANKVKFYTQNSLKDGEWEIYITNKIWETTRRRCGYNFKRNYVAKDKRSGNIQGSCHCTSDLDVRFETEGGDVVFNITVTKGNGDCRKTYIRKPLRDDYGNILQHQTAEELRTNLANKLMRPYDPEPPHLPKNEVFRNIKKGFKDANHFHKDPFIAITYMKSTTYANIIHDISFDPFYVHFWSSHQRDVYSRYAAKDKNTCVFIDSTGGIFSKFVRFNGVKTNSIFLHVIAAYFNGQQFTVGQMISDAQDTITILNFWNRWLKYGFPPPSEVVMDSSEGLLNATTIALTEYKTIDEYCNALKNDEIPKVYIRLDVAHFMRLYAKDLNKCRPMIRIFYLACIGKLICMTDEDEIRKWVKAIFTVALSETTGLLPSGEESPCSLAKSFLRDIITGSQYEQMGKDADEAYLQEIESTISEKNDNNDNGGENESVGTEKIVNENSTDNKNEETSWKIWGSEIENEVKAEINDNGSEPNAHLNNIIVKRLRKDSKRIVLWSCIVHKKFNRGRIPASSAPVESEFKRVKKCPCKSKKRVDENLEALLEFIEGRTKIVDANTQSTTEEHIDEFTTDETTDTVDCEACQNGNIPSGAHRCLRCNKPVHLLDGCSSHVEGQEEGYGEMRLCSTCRLIDPSFTSQLLAKRQFENWRGEGVPKSEKKSNSTYLGQKTHIISEKLLYEKNVGLPILKNGGRVDLHAVRFDGRAITFSNTCAFDSIFQILVATACDYHELLGQMLDYNDDTLFPFVIRTFLNRVDISSYQSRARILIDYFDSENNKIICGVESISCATNVATYAAYLFRQFPSLIEVSKCSNQCEEKKTVLPVINLNVQALDDNFSLVFEKYVFFDKPCAGEDCEERMKVKVKESSIGDIVIFEPYLSDGKPVLRKLKSLPIEAKISDDEKLRLLGIVHYQEPKHSRSSDKDKSQRSEKNGKKQIIGHYMAFSLRSDGQWVKYDDLLEKSINAKKTFDANVALMFYGKLKTKKQYSV